MVLTKRTQIGLWATELLTALAGVVNLLFAVTPNLPSRVQWLEQVFPLTLASGTTGFLVLDQQYAVNQLVLQTLLMFLTTDNASLEPQIGSGASLPNQFT